LKDKNLLWIIFYDYEYNELFCINTRPVKPDNSCHLLRPRSYHKRIFDDFLEGSWRGRYEGIHTDNVRKEVCCTEDSSRKQKAHSVSFSIDKEILKAHVQLPLYTHGSGQGFPLPALTVSPPNFFTPNRFAFESRPFFVLPAPFLCAINFTPYFLINIDILYKNSR
jgi:hypothetical protein